MNETDLLKQVKNGNPDAFRFLISDYKKLVLHLVGRVISQSDDIEDVCQDVFLKVFREIKKFRGDSKLSTWIATIAYNTSISFVKSKSRKGEKYMEEIGLAEKRWLADDHVLHSENEELQALLMRMIEKLPVQYRTVITLFYLDEFSYREIRQITGMPEGTVKSYLSRAKNLLKQKIEKLQLNEKFYLLPEYAGK